MLTVEVCKECHSLVFSNFAIRVLHFSWLPGSPLRTAELGGAGRTFRRAHCPCSQPACISTHSGLSGVWRRVPGKQMMAKATGSSHSAPWDPRWAENSEQPCAPHTDVSAQERPRPRRPGPAGSCRIVKLMPVVVQCGQRPHTFKFTPHENSY